MCDRERLPSVKVPVLSKKTFLTLRMRSRLEEFLMRIPIFCAFFNANPKVSGDPKAKAQGQANTKSANDRLKAAEKSIKE
ncbi:hypothetical protein D3C86_1955170 [compost metagenome]